MPSFKHRTLHSIATEHQWLHFQVGFMDTTTLLVSENTRMITSSNIVLTQGILCMQEIKHTSIFTHDAIIGKLFHLSLQWKEVPLVLCLCGSMQLWVGHSYYS